MRVRILHGNEAGLVKDLDRVAAEVAIQTGFTVAVPDEPPPAPVPEKAEQVEVEAPAPRKRTK